MPFYRLFLLILLFMQRAQAQDLAPAEEPPVVKVTERIAELCTIDLRIEDKMRERPTHDYVRNGTPSLFAALKVATSEMIGQSQRRHRHQVFFEFHNDLDSKRKREPVFEIHMVLDNYGTHKTAAVKRWFLRHPEYHLHFTPTSGSWLNQVERFFEEIREKRIRRGEFRSVASIEAAIRECHDHHNTSPKHFRWNADADLILNRVKNVFERTSDSRYSSFMHERGRNRPERLAPAFSDPELSDRRNPGFRDTPIDSILRANMRYVTHCGCERGVATALRLIRDRFRRDHKQAMRVGRISGASWPRSGLELQMSRKIACSGKVSESPEPAA